MNIELKNATLSGTGEKFKELCVEFKELIAVKRHPADVLDCRVYPAEGECLKYGILSINI